MQLESIRKCALFSGFSDEEILRLFDVLDPIERSYVKGELLLNEGDQNYYFRIILSGSAYAVKSSVDGGASVYTSLYPGNVFGGVIAVSGGMPSEVSVKAYEDCRCLLLDHRKVVDTVLPEGALRERLLANITKDLAYKYFDLKDRIDCITCSSLREKILTYLRLNKSKNSNTVFVSQSRSRLAAYLNADRAALCRELSRMRDDGLIEYYGSTFKLLI